MITRQFSAASAEKGNIFFALFGAVALIGVLGVGLTTFIKGPLATSVKINRQNVAENQMMIGAQVAVMSAASAANNGDCDNDGMVEPLEWRDAGALPKPAGGGLIPLSIGVNKKDPWGTDYGYCVWDHGLSTNGAGTCGGAGQKRLSGTGSNAYAAVALISAGPDKIFTTTCRNFATADINGDGDLLDATDLALVSKAAATDDDVIFTYTYEEATGASGGLWSLKSSDASTATINKNIETSGSGSFIGLTTNSITARTGDSIDMTDGLKLPDAGSFNVACTVGMNGVMRRNASGNGLEICDGSSTTWKGISGGGGVQIVSTTPDIVITPQQNNSMNIDATSCVTATCYGSTIDFYAANQGQQTSSALSATLSNTTNFEFVSNTCAGITLASGQSCLMRVRAKATGNLVYTGTLKINQHNQPIAILQGESVGFGCSPGRSGGGGIYVLCNIDDGDGTYNLVVMPSGCNGNTTNPTCSGTDAAAVMRTWGVTGDIPNICLNTVSSPLCLGPKSSVNLKALQDLGYGAFPANEYCRTMNYSGKTDWYLPSPNELISRIYPKISNATLTGFANNAYWTSAQNSNSTYGNAGHVHLGTGASSSTNRGSNLYIRCLRRDTIALPTSTADTNPDNVPGGFPIVVAFSSGALVTSATMTVTGIMQPISASITGGSSMNIIKNGSPVSASSISGLKINDTLAFQIAAPTTIGTKLTATITIGSDTYTWEVGYADQTREIRAFVTSSRFQPPQIAGLVNADNLCNQHAASSSLALSSSWKALLSTSGANARDRIPWNWGLMKRVDGSANIVDGGFPDLFDGTLDQAIALDENGTLVTAPVWTGSQTDGTIPPAALASTSSYSGNAYDGNCNDFSSLTYDDRYANAGASDNAGTGWMTMYSAYCNDNDGYRLYCIENIDSSGSVTPAKLNPAYKVQVPVNTVVYSEPVTIRGMGTAATQTMSVTATGGSPAFSVNGGAYVTSGTIRTGDSVVLRLTSPASGNSSNKMTITAGTMTDTWRVWTGDTTGSAVKRVFVFQLTGSQSTAQGGPGGLDSICQSAGASLGGTWKAIASGDGASETEWAVNRIGYNWSTLRRIDGIDVALAGNIWSADTIPLLAPISIDKDGNVVSVGYVKTGSDIRGKAAVRTADGQCKGWNYEPTDGTASLIQYAPYNGSSGSTGAAWINNGTRNNDNGAGHCGPYGLTYLYCVEQ